MANIREIQSRINSVKDTMKITNAMYMILSLIHIYGTVDIEDLRTILRVVCGKVESL